MGARHSLPVRSLSGRAKGARRRKRTTVASDNSLERVWLILEDELLLRDALSEMMLYWKITPLIFEDGYEAIDWLEKVEAGKAEGPLPELALIDIRLPPGPQGHEVAQRIRTLPAMAGIAIVIMTAFRFSPEERIQIEQAAWPDLFIQKPFPDPDAFKVMLESVLKSSQV